jgi:hypothetical protein
VHIQEHLVGGRIVEDPLIRRAPVPQVPGELAATPQRGRSLRVRLRIGRGNSS